MNVLALIPARGGSKGIPRKNLRPIAGRPLIEWTIAAARTVEGIARVVVSTDDAAIADAARAAGADIPFLRPAELASDEASGMAPVFHALEQLPEFDAVLLLQPTSPLRSADDIAAVLRIAERDGSAVVSVCQPAEHPAWMYRMNAGDVLSPLLLGTPATRRQDHESAWALNGAIYFATRQWLIDHGSFVAAGTRGFVMPPERSVDIDTLLDWKLAEMLLNEARA